MISICGALSECDGCVEISEHGRRTEGFLQTILEWLHGISAHDTFNRVLGLLKSEALQDCLIGCRQSVRDEAGDSREKRRTAIDGKSLRSTFDRAATKNMLHFVSVWSTARSISMMHRHTLREECRDFLSSCHLSTRKLATFSRRHWSIENNLHCFLDVSFHEKISVAYAAGTPPRTWHFSIASDSRCWKPVKRSRPASPANAKSPAGTTTASSKLD